MIKKTAIKLGIVLFIVFILGSIVYFYFPSIWGEAVYPLDYKVYILKYSKEYNVDPAFIAALIYSESHYNPNASSRVGARGLMQIMPSTGASIAKNLGVANYNPDILFDPETNIRFGTWYISMYMERYNGDQESTLAAYNGGGGVGDRYVVSRDSAGLPQETRGYLGKVIGTEEMYKKIYQKELYPPVITYEDVASKLKVQSKPSFFQKIVNFLKDKIGGK